MFMGIIIYIELDFGLLTFSYFLFLRFKWDKTSIWIKKKNNEINYHTGRISMRCVMLVSLLSQMFILGPNGTYYNQDTTWKVVQYEENFKVVFAIGPQRIGKWKGKVLLFLLKLFMQSLIRFNLQWQTEKLLNSSKVQSYDAWG